MRKMKELLMRLKYIKACGLIYYDATTFEGSYEAKSIWSKEKFNLESKEDEDKLDRMIAAFNKIYINGDVILSAHIRKRDTDLPRLYIFEFSYHQDDDGV